jgi:surface carbohydrate biosynthesis protein
MSDAAPVRARLAWEHTHRELLPSLLTLRALEARGIPWQLRHVRKLERQPGREVLLMPFYYDPSDVDRYLFRTGVAGKVLLNMLYEQMHFACARNYLLPDGPLAHAHMTHCAWGPRFVELLVAHGVAPERIRITGHPRFDVYAHPELLLSRETMAEKYGLDAGKPWILVPYNFNLAYIRDDLRASLIARGYALTQPFIDGVRDARDAFTAMVRTLAAAVPGAELILRVHPAGYEAASLYAGDAKRFENLHVIAQYDIANWIRQSALTIVWNSTSAMECMVAGTPVIGYEPEPFGERFDYDVNRILPTYRNVDEVVDLARRAPDVTLRYDWALFERWYAHRDGRNTERLADVVAELAGDYDAHAAPAGFEPPLRGRVRAALERTPVAERLVRSKRHIPPQPGEDALREAVRRGSAEPLLDLLR